MKVGKIINTSKKTRTLVHVTNKQMPKTKCVNPYAPFEGVDGKNYAISYPSGLNEFTNCYAFALGMREMGIPEFDYYPGFISGFPLNYDIADNLEERVRADLAALGRTVYEVIYAKDIPLHLSKAENGTVWIKALKSPKKKEGIHFMIKNEESGRWIHKVGWSMPPKVVVRNLEVKSGFDFFLEKNPNYREEFSKMPKEYQEIAKRTLESATALASSKLEDEDNASYFSFEEAKYLEEYKPLWVMRISE